MKATTKPVASLHTLLQDESGSLSTLFKKATVLTQLQDYLRAALTPPLNQHVSVANLSGGNLTLYSDSPAWAARLRFRIPDMYRIAENYGIDNLKSIRIKVIRLSQETSNPKAKISLSKRSAALILESAGLIRDEVLRRSLMRLGSHTP